MKELELAFLRSAVRVHELCRAQGHQPHLTLGVMAAAFELCRPAIPHEQLLVQAQGFFRTKAALIPKGLETLPSCWLCGLPPLLWQTRKAHHTHLTWMLDGVGFESGILRLSFAQEAPINESRLTRWDGLRLKLNLCLRPNLWHPLSLRVQREIWNRHPDLRSDLFRLPV